LSEELLALRTLRDVILSGPNSGESEEEFLLRLGELTDLAAELEDL